MVPFLQSDLLTKIPNIRHGFFTHQGGVSEGDFATLNAAREKADSPENVQETRRRIAQTLAFDAQNLVTPYQHHTTVALVIDRPFEGTPPKADALITTTPGLLISVVTADCVPVLLATPQGDMVAAIHAGWRGAVGGILETTIEKMRALGALQITAAIGPCIWQDSYEVTQEFYDNLSDTPQFFKPGKRPDHWQFDLPGYTLYRLSNAGIQSISPSPADTFTDEARFFSSRRRTFLGREHFGCNLSGIGISQSTDHE